jgi:hypothetical protein
MDDIDLHPPAVASGAHTGLVLDVAAVGLRNPLALDPEQTHAYIRCTDGLTYRLPAALQQWAITVIGAQYARRGAGNRSMFPGQIEFGVLDGGVYAELV